ncbi:NADH-ubiquinone oxidoreductase-F iron-sulfur binding region domain-containing protein [Schumannella sp. 10F1B-5-1]|uniref:NADH-ubiquinone oxidoreductase-F iron-sulfur binding region domain-containing protein n=1 Tax=Schumannella sp. 10F1B-5-1 TaxID=2590780 RepID=UPI001130D6BC|nr:NADH-ubiquinone oxidoreductase-F iron-sulfur binding region domain-containing protein [Schumannella sp. 10F1B-5-1]TPW72979.1 NADH-quinone oxidoreductase subunit F [Schumannella sp. 10F1B-5-1]
MTLLDPAPTASHPVALAAPTGVRRLLAAGGPDPDAHRATFGARPRPTPDRLIAEAEVAGLTGRGGAGFPVHRKLRAAAEAGGGTNRRTGAGPGAGTPVVIGNGSEGEPLSAKDRLLLRTAPQLVLDGLLLAAEAIGAGEIRLVADAELHAGLRTALAAHDEGARIQLAAARGDFVGGEASAVVSALEGRRPVPRDHAIRLTGSGYRRRPTLLQNVETLAHLALIARFGGAWFRSIGGAAADPADDAGAGSPIDAGTRLVTASAPGTALTVLEVAGGTRLGTVLAAARLDDAGVRASGLGAGVRAVLVGGYHGAWVPAAALDAPFSVAGLAPWGATPGAGILHVLPHGRCGLRVAAGITRMLAAESAGQCGPCVNGLPRIAGLLERVARGERDPGLTDEIARVGELVAGRGACHHPDGTLRLVASTLREFASDIAAHRAGTCEEEGR